MSKDLNGSLLFQSDLIKESGRRNCYKTIDKGEM